MHDEADAGRRIGERRRALGLTQSQLAARAQVSRALVGALERGRHMPAADAAVRLARALDASVERLFAPNEPVPGLRAVPVVGPGLPDGVLVRAAQVGGVQVARVVDPLSSLSAAADGVVVDGRVRLFAGAAPRGAVVAGCDPVLGVAERLLEAAGPARIVGVPASTAQAIKALEAGRCHAALVHGPRARLKPGPGLQRWHFARWRSGVASHPRLAHPSLEALLGGDVELVQRDRGAACQQAVDRAARRLGMPRPVAHRTAPGHLDAARTALEHGVAAVAIEPVAVAMGLDFTALEVHDVQLWVPEDWTRLPGLRALLDLLGSARFRDRAGALAAYDFEDTGAVR